MNGVLKGVRLCIIVILSLSLCLCASCGNDNSSESLGSSAGSTGEGTTTTKASVPTVSETITTSGGGTSAVSSTTKEASTSTTEATTTLPTSAPTTFIKPAEGKVVAFTFDDGPSYTDSTKKILDKLEELNMKATFFMVGERVNSGSEAILKRMVSLGCEIGNHSFDHSYYNQIKLDAVMEQINKTNELIEKHSGDKPSLMRPPGGSLSKEFAAEIDMTVICWSVDTLDWKLRKESDGVNKIYERALPMIDSGDIVLMHDIYQESADAFCKLADELVAQGYTLVTVSELLGSEKLASHTTFYGFEK